MSAVALRLIYFGWQRTWLVPWGPIVLILLFMTVNGKITEFDWGGITMYILLWMMAAGRALFERKFS